MFVNSLDPLLTAWQYERLDDVLAQAQHYHCNAQELLASSEMLRDIARRINVEVPLADVRERLLESVGWVFIWQLRRRPDLAEAMQPFIAAITWPNIYIERDVNKELLAARRYFETTELDLVFNEGSIHFYMTAQVG